MDNQDIENTEQEERQEGQGLAQIGEIIEDVEHSRIVELRTVENVMEDSYLRYSMSVIVARALPDVRDGMKPVHRRILYSMNNEGLRSGARHRKSANVVGSVMGKYHPHGDSSIYDAMVRMAQPWSMRYMLINGQGNFGSMDGDPPAAMRYTEAKMATVADELLADIDKNTVEFRDNYDGTTQEPSVLPAKLPNLLLNGQLGIAVGMATNIPPHNLGELIDATIHQIDHPDATLDDLLIHIKGPDFPTGGIVYGKDSLRTAYATGRGGVVVRGVAEVVEGNKGRHQIVITEIPYGLNKASLIEKIADLYKEKKITGISDLRDESARGNVRIVIDLKKDAYPKKLLNQLFKLTPLQMTFHYNMLALIDGIQPRILGLQDIISEHIKHRQVVVRRRTEFELRKAKERAHILEGLKIALDNIDEVINTIRSSETTDEAQANLMGKFGLSEIQAKAILAMQLRTLAGLERKKIEDELAQLIKLIAELEAIQHAQHIFGCDRSELVGRRKNRTFSIGGSFIAHTPDISEAGIKIKIELIADFLINLKRSIGSFKPGIDFHTLVVDIAHRQNILCFIGAVAHAEVMVMRERSFVCLFGIIDRLYTFIVIDTLGIVISGCRTSDGP